jgi:lysophospholipase L1-like esterase
MVGAVIHRVEDLSGRHSSSFDGFLDFDAALRDPQHPDLILRDFDSGDHFHPNPAGYKRIGGSFPLSLFAGTTKIGF